jgi:5-methyltetrahydrofolate--homocysteine methyltransferase
MEFSSLLNQNEILLFDGSMGTQLMTRGLEQGKIPDMWNIEHRSIIQEIFENYYTAGSDLVQTATFRANGVALKKHGLFDRIEEINKASGEVLQAICPEDKCKIGDIGPSGEFLPPVGKISGDELETGFRIQTKTLEPYIDAWHLETFSDLQEMKIAINAVHSESKKPIIASMTYKRAPKGFFTVMGNSVSQCIAELIASGVTVVGSNCTLGSDDFVDLAKTMRNIEPNFPFSIKPNAGQPILEGGKTVYKQSPEYFAKDIEKILDFNIQIVGGCCGTTERHIHLLREKINEYKER